MAFPQTALPVSFHIAPGADPNDPSTYQFTEITTDVRYASGIQIQAGRQDESSQVNTTSHQVTLDNSSGKYSRRNPNGQWYGQLRSGTPVQTRVMLINDQFDRVVASGMGTDADSGLAWTADGFWSVDGANANVTLAVNFATLPILNSVRGDDVDIVKVTSLNQVATGGAWVDSTVVRYADSSNYYRLHTEFGTGGVVSVKVTRLVGGVATDIFNTTATSVSYSAGTKISTRVQAIGPTFRIKVWLTSGSEPAAWTASVTDTSTTVRLNSVGLYTWRVGGNTNTNPLTMTLYSYRCDVIRATTPVPEWSARWNQPQTNNTTPIVGAGILRRLSQGQSALRSPLYRGILGENPAGFWPLEDGQNSTSCASAVVGVPAASANDVTFGSNSAPPGASASITMNSNASSVTGAASNAPTPPIGYACTVLVKYGSIPGSTLQMAQWTTAGTVTSWVITSNGTTYNIIGTDVSGTTIVSSLGNLFSLSDPPVDPTQWFAMQLEVESLGGGTVAWNLTLNQTGSANFLTVNGTYSGTVGRAIAFKLGGTANVSYTMCSLGDAATLDFFSLKFVAMCSGFAGETGGTRALRLAAEEDIPLIVMGDPTATAQMGVQTAQTFIALLRECEEADQGLLIERGAGLGYLTRGFRYNVPVSMALDFAAGQVSAAPEPTDDDLNLRNVIKLTRANGSEYPVQDSTSVALSGAYTDERTVNLFVDSQLPGQAGWRLHMGTLDELRWPKITLKLHATPSLIPTWCGLRIGSRITIANPPAAVAGGQLDLIIEGYTETITSFTWDVEINCSPATAWDVGIYDAARYDSQTSTLAGNLTTSTTSWPITAAVLSDCWERVAVPYDVLVGGERCTVTAATAPSGTGPFTQTLTCTRSVNGIVKAHSTGESIRIATPGRYAL